MRTNCMPRWTAEEDDVIRTYYPTEGGNVSKRFANRTHDACRMRACHLEIKRNDVKKPVPWKSKEMQILMEYYPEERAAVVKRLPRHTVTACKWQYYAQRARQTDEQAKACSERRKFYNARRKILYLCEKFDINISDIT